MGNGTLLRPMPTETTPKIPAWEIDNVRSYMFNVEAKKTLHLDRLGADDVVKALEKMAVSDKTWVCTDGVVLIIKLYNDWKVKIMRDAVIVKAGDYVLIADDRFILLTADKDGRFVPVAKGSEITWNGTEEYFTPFDIHRLARDVARRILEQMHWL